MKKYLPFVFILIVLAGALGIAAKLWKSGTPGTGATTQPFSGNGSTAASNAEPANKSESSAGLTKPNVKVSSPVVLEEYGDYQCPPCGLLYPVLKDIEHEYGKQLQIVFHHFPLAKIHKNAMNAARAAEAARNQGKFWEMHDRLYRNQNTWKDLDDPRSVFIQYAQELGLNTDRFTRDLDSPEVEQRIAADMQKGTSVGVTGTPTVFIEGQM